MRDTESCSSRAVDFVGSESKCRKRRVKVEVYGEIPFRLKQLNEEETRQPHYQDDLWAHFYRLPNRYFSPHHPKKENTEGSLSSANLIFLILIKETNDR